MRLLLAFVCFSIPGGPSLSAAPADSPARRILLAVRTATVENSRRPEGGPAPAGAGKDARLSGDALADSLARAAFRAARQEVEGGTPPGECARGLLVALGVSLDPSGLLRKNPAARLLIGTLETPEEERARSRALGAPSLRGRLDSLQHFAVSAALAAVVGKEAAWAVGLDKETVDAAEKDRGRGSGFSFADLAADRSGLAFATLVLGEAATREKLVALLDRLASGFRGADFAPDFRRLAEDPAEGLGWREFSERFGSILDPRFLERIRALGEEVEKCPGLKGVNS